MYTPHYVIATSPIHHILTRTISFVSGSWCMRLASTWMAISCTPPLSLSSRESKDLRPPCETICCLHHGTAPCVNLEGSQLYCCALLLVSSRFTSDSILVFIYRVRSAASIWCYSNVVVRKYRSLSCWGKYVPSYINAAYRSWHLHLPFEMLLDATGFYNIIP